MEENVEEIVPSNTPPQLIVSEDMRSYIYETTKWAKFLAIVGFVISAFLTLTSFTIGAAMQSNAELAAAMASSKLSPTVITILCLVYTFAIFYPSMLLFRYANKAQLGVLYGEQASLDEAFSKLKSLFKYWSVITLIGIVLYIMLVILQAVGR